MILQNTAFHGADCGAHGSELNEDIRTVSVFGYHFFYTLQLADSPVNPWNFDTVIGAGMGCFVCFGHLVSRIKDCLFAMTAVFAGAFLVFIAAAAVFTALVVFIAFTVVAAGAVRILAFRIITSHFINLLN